VVLTVQVSPAVGTPVVSAPAHQTGQVGEALSLQLVADGEVEAFGVSGLPMGLQFDAETGSISGEPLESGEFAYQAFAINEAGVGLSVPMTFSIDPPGGTPQITGPLAIEIPLGLQSSFAISSDPQASTYSIGTLPVGLSGNALTGEIAGSAITEGTFEVIVRGVNAVGEGPPATLVLTIRPPTSQEALDAWLDTFAALSNPDDRLPLANPSGDGIPNLMKYAFGMDPTIASRDGLPVASFAAEGDVDFLMLTIQKNPTAHGAVLIPEVSTNLASDNWHSGEDHFEVLHEDAESLTVRSRAPVSESPAQFLRVRVEME